MRDAILRKCAVTYPGSLSHIFVPTGTHLKTVLWILILTILMITAYLTAYVFSMASKISWLDPDQDLAESVVNRPPELESVISLFGSIDTRRIPVCELRYLLRQIRIRTLA